MENILNQFNIKLIETLELKVSNKEKIYIENHFDTLSTLITVSKTEKAFKELVDLSCLEREVIDFQYSKEDINEVIEKGYVKISDFLGENKLHISFQGLYELYRLKNWDLNLVFRQIDLHKFPNRRLKLKIQEKLWCIFLILIEADSAEKAFDTNIIGNEKLEKYFGFIKIVEKVIDNSGILIGSKVNWGKGKDANLRSFITNTVDLPKTGIYHYSGKKYWLDLSSKRNAKNILDLILDGHDGHKRILINELLKNCFFRLTGELLTELNESHDTYNNFIKSELS
jgi:hypothetical protein